MAQPTPPQQMFQLVTGYWVSQLMGTAARLGLADRLASGPRPAAELAREAGVDPEALHRVLRACASLGVFTEQGSRTYGNTPLSLTLRSGPGTMRDMAIAQTGPGHWRPWEALAEAVKTGRPTTRPVLGRELWEWYGDHPQEAQAFSGAMDGLAAMVAAEVVAAVDFSRARTVVDVGGAHGTLVRAVLQAFPQPAGVLLDLPHVVEGGRQVLAAAGLERRCEVVGGDFFRAVPAGDVLLLKQVLHDWDDQQCVTLLKNCAAALPVGGRALVVEMVVSEDGTPSPAHLMDINMLVLLPGKERTAGEYRALMAAAGLRLERVLPTHSPFSILEAVRTA